MERDWTNAGGERNTRRYGGQEQTGTSSVIFKFFLLSSPSHSSSFPLPLFYRVQRQAIGMGRDRRGRDNVLFAPSSGGRGQQVCVPLFLCSIFSSSLLITVLIFRLLPLLFVSLCSLSVVSPPSQFLVTGPRFGTTKSKIWLIVKFLFFFL